MIHKWLNYLGCPQESDAGHKLGILGRLTHGWLWSDDPALGELDEELRRQGK